MRSNEIIGKCWSENKDLQFNSMEEEEIQYGNKVSYKHIPHCKCISGYRKYNKRKFKCTNKAQQIVDIMIQSDEAGYEANVSIMHETNNIVPRQKVNINLTGCLKIIHQ